MAIGLRLTVKKLPTGHAHHPRPNPLLRQHFSSLQGQMDLGASGDEDQIGLPLGRLGQDVGPLCQPGGIALGHGRAAEDGEPLTG